MKMTAALLFLIPLAGIALQAAHAATQSIHATVVFQSGLIVGNEHEIDFNTIQASGSPGAGDTVSMGSNGVITYNGVFSGNGTGTAGSVDILAGTNGLVVEVFCDPSALLSNGAGGTIAATIEASPENSLGAYGTGQPCNGVSGAPSGVLILGVGTLDTFKFGGQLNGATATSFTPGTYSTANPGGNDVQVNLPYQ